MARDTQIAMPRLRTVFLAILVVVALVGVGAVGSACRDTLALQGTPAASFTITSTGSALTVTHDGGDTITDDQYTVALSILVATPGHDTARYTWANETAGGFPIGAGDSLTIQHPTLTNGTVIRVVHRGYEVPRFCPTRGAPQRMILAKETL